MPVLYDWQAGAMQHANRTSAAIKYLNIEPSPFGIVSV
jgi:hypothetical protein